MIDYGMTNTSIIAADGRPSEPEWHRIIQLALNNRNLTRDEINELNETDIILTDENGGPSRCRSLHQGGRPTT